MLAWLYDRRTEPGEKGWVPRDGGVRLERQAVATECAGWTGGYTYNYGATLLSLQRALRLSFSYVTAKLVLSLYSY
jgi:hypothetical protein